MEKQYITCKDVPGGILKDGHIKAVRAINIAPTFNRKEKPWQLVRIPKSTTRNVAWIVKMNEDHFLVTQYFARGEFVSFMASDPKGKPTVWKPIETYPQYLDLETAVDKFYKERYETTNEENEQLQ
jgi:hypothetical protein